MRKVTLAVLALAAVAVVAALVQGLAPSAGTASSHREAPSISEDPTADNTDLYAFRSPDRPDTVTIISNVIPAEDPGCGPDVLRVLAVGSLQHLPRPERRRARGDHVPLQLPPEHERRVPPQHGAAVHGDEDRERPLAGRCIREHAAEQHRLAHDPRIPAARAERRGTARGRWPGLRRPARRRLLRRHRSDLRLARLPPRDGERRGWQGLLRRLRRSHHLAAAADRRPGRPGRDRRGLDLGRSSADPRSDGDEEGAGQERQEHGRQPSVGAGLPPRQPARQRGDHPDRAEGRVEPERSERRLAVRRALHAARPRSADQPALPRCRQCARAEPRRSRLGAPHGRAEPELHRPGAGGHAPPEPLDRADVGRRSGQPPRRLRQRPRGLPERAAPRGRRDRHRRACGGREAQGQRERRRAG